LLARSIAPLRYQSHYPRQGNGHAHGEPGNGGWSEFLCALGNASNVHPASQSAFHLTVGNPFAIPADPYRRTLMRPMNKRLVFTGVFLIALAIAFFLFFLSIASKSNDPVKLLRTAGTVSGVLVGIGVALLVSGRPRKAA
jgi:hypothetical protein